ncbi:Aste57867_19447 [Aphanomyces stellatus]|uniref:Aste57867_19447 protein n=1 Tax=Aphanomyces stellatus TaxID=120398 RepID=A0A485LCU7_9STRA|nr:hypothetical protein As57867_019383 [Aphanomyces stellatus]VFT96160.1 Aste57867_19447 [Aphanomyces stellatus]
MAPPGDGMAAPRSDAGGTPGGIILQDDNFSAWNRAFSLAASAKGWMKYYTDPTFEDPRIALQTMAKLPTVIEFESLRRPSVPPTNLSTNELAEWKEREEAHRMALRQKKFIELADTVASELQGEARAFLLSTLSPSLQKETCEMESPFSMYMSIVARFESSSVGPLILLGQLMDSKYSPGNNLDQHMDRTENLVTMLRASVVPSDWSRLSATEYDEHIWDAFRSLFLLQSLTALSPHVLLSQPANERIPIALLKKRVYDLMAPTPVVQKANEFAIELPPVAAPIPKEEPQLKLELPSPENVQPSPTRSLSPPPSVAPPEPEPMPRPSLPPPTEVVETPDGPPAPQPATADEMTKPVLPPAALVSVKPKAKEPKKPKVSRASSTPVLLDFSWSIPKKSKCTTPPMERSNDGENTSPLPASVTSDLEPSTKATGITIDLPPEKPQNLGSCSSVSSVEGTSKKIAESDMPPDKPSQLGRRLSASDTTSVNSSCTGNNTPLAAPLVRRASTSSMPPPSLREEPPSHRPPTDDVVEPPASKRRRREEKSSRWAPKPPQQPSAAVGVSATGVAVMASKYGSSTPKPLQNEVMPSKYGTATGTWSEPKRNELHLDVENVVVDETDVARTVYISQINHTVTEATLEKLCAPYDIDMDAETKFPRIEVFMCQRTRRPRGDAIVCFKTADAVHSAISSLHGMQVKNITFKARPMDVSTRRLLEVQVYQDKPFWTCAGCRSQVSSWRGRCDSCSKPRVFPPNRVDLTPSDWLCKVCLCANASTADACLGCSLPTWAAPRETTV